MLSAQPHQGSMQKKGAPGFVQNPTAFQSWQRTATMDLSDLQR